MIKTTILSSVTLAMILGSSVAQAQQFTVSVKNLTHAIHFTPLLISAHNDSTHLYETGVKASGELKAMAEGGNIDGLVTLLNTAGATSITNPASGLLSPGSSSPASEFDTATSGNDYLSVVAMMLPTNDGFIGLNGWEIPTKAGTYTVDINAYDAGTEANNELLGVANAGAPSTLGIPAAPTGPVGTNGTGVADEDSNKTIHIHRGTLGDTNATGGSSDLDSRVHRWLNPVARITVIVK